MNTEINIYEPFGAAIHDTILRLNLRNNLEIGSWDGAGSTDCFYRAMKQLPGLKRLQCIEIDPEKFKVLQARYAEDDFVHCFNGSSISYSQLIDNNFDVLWGGPYNKIPSIYSKELVRSWFLRDVEGMKNSPAFLAEPTAAPYDSVLIDGSEFTGYSEFVLLRDKARVIFLDDVHQAFKCYRAYRELLNDPRWYLIQERPDVRNGFAIFSKKTVI